jgi:hypothetical protein
MSNNDDTIGVLGSNSRTRTPTDTFLQNQFDTLKSGYENYVGEGVTRQIGPETRTKMDIYLQNTFNTIDRSKK